VAEGSVRFEDEDDGLMGSFTYGNGTWDGDGTGLDMMNETKLQHLFASI